MYVYMYNVMSVCNDVGMCTCRYVYNDVDVFICKYACRLTCMCVSMYASRYVCMHVCTYVYMEIVCMKLGMHVGYSVRLSVYVVYSCTWSFKGNAGIAKKSHHGWYDRMGKLGCKR
ncbi:hypothetical protein HanPI659440_Chr01g0012701 [Helianthus annuus]|nr:hypothetical protein HanPI659440_Chr01g0012701 [Helianthus annuus]